MKRSLPLVLFLFVLGCTSLQQPAEPVRVVLVGTTDVHGWFNGHAEAPPGREGVVWGGLPAFASYVEALRAEHRGHVVVLDAGDMFQGTIESNMFEGEAMVQGYNVIGYHGAAVGNHEFDFGPVGPEAIARNPGDDPLGALKRNARMARFPLLSANMIEKATGRVPTWAQPFTIVRIGGVRVGVIGLSTPDTPNVTMAANVESLEFTDPVEATIAAARELRARGVHAVVVTAHIGGRCTNMEEPHAPESCDRQQEAMEYLERLPAGTIDAYFGGHTHAQMRHYINGVPAVQALAFSREFSTIDLWIDRSGRRVVRSEIRPHTMICTFVYEGTEHCDPRLAAEDAKLVPRVYGNRTIRPHAQVVAAIEPYLRKVAAKRDEKLGTVAATPFQRSYIGESPLGNLITDALRAGTGAEIAFMNSGGIRAELPAGELTYGHVFAVSPFDNYPAMVVMSGQQVVDLLNATSGGARGILQVSGLRYTIDMAVDADKQPADRKRVVSVTNEDGSPFDVNRYYGVVMPDFVAAGGDGTQDVMATVPPHRIQIFYARAVRDVLVDELRKKTEPLVPKLEGRITVLNPPPPRQ